MVKTPYKVFIKITYTAKFPSPLRGGCSVERRCAEMRRRKDQGSGKHSSNDSPLVVCPFPDVRSAEPKGGHGISERPHPRRMGFQL